MKVLIIGTSPRKGGNSELLVEEFAKGARDNGNEVEVVSLFDKEIKFCRGCLACQKTGSCIIKDDVEDILEKMIDSDVIVFGTPIYFYEMCGQMKTFLDRTNPIFPKKYNFKDIYLIGTAADDSENSFDGAIKGLEGWIECFDNARFAGIVKGVGVNGVGAVKNKKVLLDMAYNMGKTIR